ncbi:MAG: hypothetical protein M0R05_02290 [Bacilli bacterium]|nr:hypothetical protein [Bacilli bacterium]MDD4077318.1 hypothetical protein [Bacilli bacterium]MDD4387823.1 hypothetical protein [Bacilli bacterium]
MSKNIKKVRIKDIIEFPVRINTFTVFLIIILYGLLLYIMASLSFPPMNYHIGLENLNYVPGTEVYNTEINPFVLVRGTAVNKSEKEGQIELGLQYRIFAYIDTVDTNKPTKIRYFYSLTDKNGKTWFLYETSKNGVDTPSSSTTPYRRVVSHSLVGNNLEVGKEAITKLYIRLRYNNNGENDKIMKITEDVIEIRNKEIKGSLFKTENSLDDILEITFTYRNFDSDKYKSNFKISFNEEKISTPFHINLQSWIITENGKAFPFLGLYNYRTPKDFTPGVETDVFKYVNPEYIYLKLEYTGNKQQTRYLYYKAAIADLL